MDTQIVKPIPWLGLVVIAIGIVLSFSHPIEAHAEPLSAPDPIDIPPCELPGPITITPPESGVFTLHPGVVPNLIISCLRFDRSHYQVGDTWQVSMVVQNVGIGSTGGTIDVEYHLCRWDEDGNQEACNIPPNPVAVIPEMGPGTSQFVQFSGDLSDMPLDHIEPGYDSWIQGIPNNIPVWLRVFVRQSGVTMGTAITEAVYPSGPDNMVAGDQDGDGWAPPDDCDDTNPDMHRYANEIVGNDDDEDCAGGPLPEGNYGCDAPVDVVYTMGNPPYPPCDGPPGFTDRFDLDMDGDTWFAVVPGAINPHGYAETAQLGDCDDFNSAVYPGAPELLVDGLDNNCNGLIDEGSGTPDWVIGSFTLVRDTEPYYFNAYQDDVWPGLRYEIELENQGDYLGDDFSAVPVNLFAPGHGVVASGTSGFLNYHQLPNGAEFACYASGLVAVVPGNGIFYEANTDNNQSPASVPHITSPDRAIGFSSDPTLQYNSGSTGIKLVTNHEVLGTCPPLPTLIGIHSAQVYWWLTINGDVIYEISSGREMVLLVDLPQPLSNHDVVCLEVTLDPNWYVLEDHNDNMFVGIYEYRNPIIGQSRFDEVATAYGRAGAAWAYSGGDLCGGMGSSQGALTAGDGVRPAAWMGLILVSFVGGGIGILGSRRLDLGRVGLILATAGGAIIGGIGGFAAGDAWDRDQALRQVAITIDAWADEPGLLPSCDLYLDPTSAVPSEGTNFEYNVGTLPLSISLLEGVQPAPSVLEISLTSPSGREAILPVPVAEDGTTFQLDLAGALSQQGSDLLFEEGEFSWFIALGYVDPGGDVLPLESVCQGSSEHVFTILPAPTAAPTDTPTEQPTMEPATPAPDTQGPQVSGVGDSPDPVFTNGNPPDTAMVSANVTDPSGVASVTLYYSSGSKTAFQVWGPMSGSGGSYNTAFGPFGSAGTYEYRIYAVDGLGNANCSTGNINACPGGTLTVIIP